MNNTHKEFKFFITALFRCAFTFIIAVAQAIHLDHKSVLSVMTLKKTYALSKTVHRHYTSQGTQLAQSAPYKVETTAKLGKATQRPQLEPPYSDLALFPVSVLCTRAARAQLLR